jgi:peroxiredoxin Q/BCP
VSKANTVVVGVSPDGIDSHNNFITKINLPFVLLSDPPKDAMKVYGAWGPRKNAQGEVSEGTIRSTALIGPDGVIKKHWIPVTDAGAHPAEVLEYLKK